jgi:hypothetical protein
VGFPQLTIHDFPGTGISSIVFRVQLSKTEEYFIYVDGCDVPERGGMCNTKTYRGDRNESIFEPACMTFGVFIG